MDSTPSLPPIETISASLRMILRGVLAVLGNWRLDYPQMRLVHRRFGASLRGIERLLVRFCAGRLWRIAQRTQGKRTPHPRDPAEIRVALPRKFGWLVLAGKHEAAGFGLQLQTVMSTPEMAALLETSAQARRVLRPWCRALAVELPWTVTKIRVQRTKRPRKPRVKPEPFRIPLPRGALSWARREGFGKLR